MNVDIRSIPATNAYRAVERVKSTLQEGQKKITDYEAIYRVYINGLEEQQKLGAYQSMSGDLDSFEGDLNMFAKMVEQVEDRLEPMPVFSTQSTPQTSAPSPVVRHHRTFLERSKLPVFSGRVEDFPEFVQQF